MKYLLSIIVSFMCFSVAAQTRWEHVVYRELDVNVEENAALYYPQEPTDGLTNFFTVVFKAFLSGKLKAYEYLDGREVFDDSHLVKIEDVLKTQEITYTKKADKKGQNTYVVEQGDLPCHLVTSFYIKEKWEIERNTSQYKRSVVAICPVLHKMGDFGTEARYPLFWLDYKELRPFISNELLMTAEMNTSLRYSMDDYFTLAKYNGEIYKVQNPRGLTLMQQYPNPDTLRVKREEIENRLKTFGKSIWIKPEPTKEELAKKQTIDTTNASEKQTDILTEEEKAVNAEIAQIRKEQDNKKAEKAARKSVRRNRRTGK